MHQNAFAAILEELSRAIGCPTLAPNEEDFCVVTFPFGLSLTLRVDQRAEQFTMSTKIGELPPGKYREQVLYEALRANDDPYPRDGNFGYLKRQNVLVIWKSFPLENLRGEEVARHLLPFLSQAQECKKAILSNSLPVISRATVKMTSPMGFFGMR